MPKMPQNSAIQVLLSEKGECSSLVLVSLYVVMRCIGCSPMQANVEDGDLEAAASVRR